MMARLNPKWRHRTWWWTQNIMSSFTLVARKTNTTHLNSIR